MLIYWLPTVGWMLSHDGLFGSAGGFDGSRPAWQLAHDTPIITRGPRGVCTTFLRTPITPADSGSSQRSKPPVVASPGVQSGSLMRPHSSKRVARGDVSARSSAIGR